MSKALKPVPTGSQLVEFDRRADGPGAMMQTLAAMQEAITEMRLDDFSLEIHSERDGDKASSHIRLRAYRHKD